MVQQPAGAGVWERLAAGEVSDMRVPAWWKNRAVEELSGGRIDLDSIEELTVE
jgi:hypothetical protein